jgi:hypothetical protein
MTTLVSFLCNTRMFHESALDSLLLGYYPFISPVEFFRLVMAENKQTKSEEIISGTRRFLFYFFHIISFSSSHAFLSSIFRF